MSKHFYGALLAGSLVAYGQPLLAQQQAGASSEAPAAPLHAAPQAATSEAPVFSAAAGFTYLQTDLTGTPGGSVGYVLGWYGIPQVYFTKHISVLGDFTNFYNYHAHTEENVHGFTGGPVYALSPFHGVTAYGFVEGGAIRDSKLGVVSWDAATVGGIGVNFKLTHALAFQLVPGEYVGSHLPNGSWQNNYTTKAGFVLTSFRVKHHG